jgi:hypothetical protein
MSGGREMLMPTSALAVVGIGNTSNNDKSIVPKSNFFILQPPWINMICFTNFKESRSKKSVNSGVPRTCFLSRHILPVLSVDSSQTALRATAQLKSA